MIITKERTGGREEADHGGCASKGAARVSVDVSQNDRGVYSEEAGSRPAREARRVLPMRDMRCDAVNDLYSFDGQS